MTFHINKDEIGRIFKHAPSRSSVWALCQRGWRVAPPAGAQTHYPLRMEWSGQDEQAAIAAATDAALEEDTHMRSARGRPMNLGEFLRLDHSFKPENSLPPGFGSVGQFALFGRRLDEANGDRLIFIGQSEDVQTALSNATDRMADAGYLKVATYVRAVYAGGPLAKGYAEEIRPYTEALRQRAETEMDEIPGL